MRTLISYAVFAAVVFGVTSIAVIPWPSTVYVLFGLCSSSQEYIAGECKTNTGNWGWCATESFIRKMRQSECSTNDGLIYFSEAQAQEVHQRLKAQSQ